MKKVKVICCACQKPMTHISKWTEVYGSKIFPEPKVTDRIWFCQGCEVLTPKSTYPTCRLSVEVQP